MNLLRRVSQRADTPQKRLGVVLTSIGLLILVGTSCYWNVKENAFLDIETHFDYYRSPRSDDQTLWVRDFWHKGKMVGYAKKCLDENIQGDWRRTIGENALFQWPEKCLVGREPEVTRTYIYWGVDEYAEEMVMGRYMALGLPMLALFGVGLGLYFGFVQRGLAWINTGS